jgi:hypothetical protein
MYARADIASQMLTINDVRTDPILVRRIKRMQQAELEGDSSDDDVQAPRREVQQIDGSDDMPDSSSRVRIPGSQQPPQSSIIEDLGDPSDSEMST